MKKARTAEASQRHEQDRPKVRRGLLAKQHFK
jgi:hypothetical protein